MRRSILRRWHARTGLAALLVLVAAVFAATANAGRTSILVARVSERSTVVTLPVDLAVTTACPAPGSGCA